MCVRAGRRLPCFTLQCFFTLRRLIVLSPVGLCLCGCVVHLFFLFGFRFTCDWRTFGVLGVIWCVC